MEEKTKKTCNLKQIPLRASFGMTSNYRHFEHASNTLPFAKILMCGEIC